jgi:hypothetical protein
MMNTGSASGRCLCGAVSFSVGFPTNWVAHCHCTLCQRAHGAAFVTWVSSQAQLFGIEDPQRVLRRYRSSTDAERGFCSRCGSSLFFRSAKWPGEVHVARANFNSALDREPQGHAFYDTHVGWFEVKDALPKRPAPD